MKYDIFDAANSAARIIKNSKTGKAMHPSLFKKVEEYAKARYEDSTLSDLIKTENGWSCLVYAKNKTAVLYITKKNNGEFDIWEKDVL